MKTIQEVLLLSSDYLNRKEISHARRQAEELLCDILGLERLKLYLEFERPLNEQELIKCREWLARRGNGEPLAYIRGFVEFYGCRLHVTPDVLIPRQETEILVDRIVQILKEKDLRGKILWDVCCGSGCIGIALKKALPDLTVVLSDLSPKALEIAKKNAEEQPVEVTFLEGDLLTPFKGMKTDYLICNPPYVSQKEFQTLDREVKQFEPSLALVGGPQGVEFYERLAKELRNYMNPQGQAWFEIGYLQGKVVQQLFVQQGWQQTKVEKDWAGHDRFFSLESE